MDQARRRAILIASLTEAPAEERLGELAPEAQILEVRADLVGDLEPRALAAATGKKLLYTLRSTFEGGAAEQAAARRQQRLAAAAEAGYDLIDLEAARDLAPALLSRIDPSRRVISWHGGPADAGALFNRFASMVSTPAWLYKLVPTALQHGDELGVLTLLEGLRREDVVAFCSGPIGTWTRLVAPRLGAPVIFGSAGEAPAAPGQPTIARLVADYGLPELPAIERLYGIVGNPVAHSLSPRLYNAAFRALGLPALYLPFHVEAFGEFWLEVVEGVGLESIGLPLAGLSVTAPFKEAALAVAAATSPLAERAGAANTLVARGELWEADTTDALGVVEPLLRLGVSLAGQAAVVVGAGGAGRVAAVGLAAAGARVSLANRGEARGLAVAAELGLPFVPLTRLDPSRFALLVNATSLGRGADEAGPFAVSDLASAAVVVDMVYRLEDGKPAPTRLVREARQRGLKTVSGIELLLAQAHPQFRQLTGREYPEGLGESLLGLVEEVP